MARQSSLEQRVRGVLDGNRRRTAMTKVVMLAGIMLASGGLIPLAMLQAAKSDQTHVPGLVSKDGLTAFSVVRGGEVEYTILYVGDFRAKTDFTRNKDKRTWSDSGVLKLKDTQVEFRRNHRMPKEIWIGGFPYSLNAGRVFVIDTVTPRPEKPFQIRQVEADIPVATKANLAKVFEASHKPEFLPISNMGYSTEYPRGSRNVVHFESYARHDQYRTRFILLHSTNNSTRDMNGTNDPKEKSWTIDDTLHLTGTDVRLRCRSETAEKLLIGNREFDLIKGRVFTLDSKNLPVQHAMFPRVLRKPTDLVRLTEHLRRELVETTTKPDTKRMSPEDVAQRADANDIALLIDLLRKRDKSFRQMYYEGTLKVSRKVDTERTNSETDADFIRRLTSFEPQLNGVVNEILVARDFDAKSEHSKSGTIADGIGFTEIRFDGKNTMKLRGVPDAHAQRRMTKGKLGELNKTTMMLPRIDILAFRPVKNHPLHPIIEEVSTTTRKATASKRPVFTVERTKPTQNKPGRWVLTFQHMEPEEGTNRREVLWYRLFFEQRANTVVITRIDNLRVTDPDEGSPDLMDVYRMALLEDYRRVNGVLVPHQTRYFMFGLNFMLRTDMKVNVMKVNDKSSLPAGVSSRGAVNDLKSLFGID